MKSISQAAQDIFVHNFLGCNSGFFVDFGCGDGINNPCGSNTYYLEQNGWQGLSVDNSQSAMSEFCRNRKTKGILQDLIGQSINDLLTNNNCPAIIDYLSFDVDDATEKVLDNFPLNNFKFKIITFEHDLYHMGDTRKNLAFSKFKNDYEILIENVTLSNYGPYEDWYIHKELCDKMNKIRLKNVTPNQILNVYGITGGREIYDGRIFNV